MIREEPEKQEPAVEQAKASEGSPPEGNAPLRAVQIVAYLYAVMRANAKSFKEAMEIAKKLLGNGISLEQTAQLSGLDIADVRKLSEDG